MFDEKQMAELIKEAEKIQDKIKITQDEVTKLQIVGDAGAGLVKVVVNGKHEVIKVTIDQSLLEDKEMLEDLIVAATNDATRKLEEQITKKMSKIADGIPKDALKDLKLPF